MADKLADLYEKYDILANAKEKVSQHSKEYIECINGTKGNDKEKKLAAQIIMKFFKYFPALQEQALNAILDLCEDEDSMIRICAMKVLPMLCKENKEHIFKVADILAQLLQLEDQDYTTACNCLIQVFKDDPINVIKAVINHIQTTTDDTIREKCVVFLYKKLVKLQEKLLPELEDLLIDEGKKIIPDSSANEFMEVIPFIISSKLSKTSAGQQEIVDLVADRAEIDRDFDPLEEGNNNVDKITMCVQYVLPIFNANVPSNKFLTYYTDQVLPQWQRIGSMENGDILQLQLLRQLAELSAHCGKLENPSLHVVQIFDKIKTYMPPPPENTELVELPNLDFSVVECLLYAFHRLARQCPDFLTSDPQVLKDFRARLTYFSRGVQGCKRSLETNISNKITLKKEDSEKVKVAPTLLSNINSLIKDLFYQKPVYKCNVNLSFKTEVASKIKVTPEKASSTVPQKRHVPITFDSSNGSTNKQVRSNKGSDNLKLYTPPSGKFSNNFPNYERSSGRGRGRSGGRGSRSRGGSGRSWRN